MKAQDAELLKVGKIAIDPTDSRLTATFEGKNITDDALDLILESIEPFGGKRIFVVEDQGLREKFLARNYTIPAEAARFFELKMKSGGASEVPEDMIFVQDENLKKYATEEAYKQLSENSGFLNSKLQDYKEQGYAGFQLMCQYSQVFGIVKDEKLIAFCRLTNIGNNHYYLSDTWVDDKSLSVEKGTELLYSHFLNTKNKRVFLIAPATRVDEFKAYGCEIPQDVVMSFVPKGPAMDKLFQDEVVKHQVNRAGVQFGKKSL